jgi:hypothetical protein
MVVPQTPVSPDPARLHDPPPVGSRNPATSKLDRHPLRSISVNDRFVGCLVEAFQVGNFERAHGLERHT